MLQATNRAQTLRPQSAPWIIHAPVSQWEHLWLVWNNTQLCCTASGKTSLRVQCLRHLVPARESKKASRMAASLSLPPLFCFTLVINFLLFSLCSQLPHYRSGLLNKTDIRDLHPTSYSNVLLSQPSAFTWLLGGRLAPHAWPTKMPQTGFHLIPWQNVSRVSQNLPSHLHKIMRLCSALRCISTKNLCTARNSAHCCSVDRQQGDLWRLRFEKKSCATPCNSYFDHKHDI